jgi:Rrf2 family iron-sulfur cluster assembly transcriptional regulator
MKLSTKGIYGLRAMVDLAVHSGDAPVSLISIAKRQNISENYLEQIIAKMRKAGLVESQRGAGGGYIITQNFKDISVGDILKAIEGDLYLVDCPGTHNTNGKRECETSDLCVSKYVWDKVNTAINTTFESITLHELVMESKQLLNSQENNKTT